MFFNESVSTDKFSGVKCAIYEAAEFGKITVEQKDAMLESVANKEFDSYMEAATGAKIAGIVASAAAVVAGGVVVGKRIYDKTHEESVANSIKKLEGLVKEIEGLKADCVKLGEKYIDKTEKIKGFDSDDEKTAGKAAEKYQKHTEEFGKKAMAIGKKLADKVKEAKSILISIKPSEAELKDEAGLKAMKVKVDELQKKLESILETSMEFWTID